MMFHENPLFQQLDPVNPDWRYQRNDPNDPRLGEQVRTRAEQYPDAQVVLLGCPQDEGVRRNQGRIGAAQAPAEIRKALYKLATLDEPFLYDLGDTPPQDTLEATHAFHAQVVEHVLRDDKRLIVLGGGNDCSYADGAGLHAARGTFTAFNVDAHFDVRADAERNSGTPYRQLLEAGYVQGEHFYEIGSLPFANSASYREYLWQQGAHVHDRDAVHELGIVPLLKAILKADAGRTIFWGLDMDVVQASDAPGVSAPNPIGLSGMEFCQIAATAARDPRSRLFEITEVNPLYDVDGRTSRLAAAAIHTFLTNLAGA